MTFKRFTSLMLAFLLALNLCVPHHAHAEGTTATASSLEELQTAIGEGKTDITVTAAIAVTEDTTISGNVTITANDVDDVFTASNGATLTLTHATMGSYTVVISK